MKKKRNPTHKPNTSVTVAISNAIERTSSLKDVTKKDLKEFEERLHNYIQDFLAQVMTVGIIKSQRLSPEAEKIMLEVAKRLGFKLDKGS